MSERAVTACFLLLVATVMTAYLCELALLLWRRWRPVEGGPGPWRRRVRVGVLVLGTVGSLCIAYGFLIEPTWVEVTHVRVPLARLPAGAPPIRIVQISDLHVEAAPRNEVDLPALVRAQRPDLIVFTGDALNSARGEERCSRWRATASASRPASTVSAARGSTSTAAWAWKAGSPPACASWRVRR